MDDEQFFEALANKKAPNDAGFEIGLAKAQSAAAPAKTETDKKAVAKKSDEDDAEGQLAIDVYQTPSDIIVESAIAGVKPEDIDINVTSDSVTIKGERRREHEAKGDDYYYQECYWGKFSRSVILPQEIDPESADVTFRGGILTVRLPKLNRKKSKKLRVKVE